MPGAERSDRAGRSLPRGRRGLARQIFHRYGRVVEEYPLAALAGHDLVAFLQILEELRAEGQVARAAPAIEGFRHGPPAAPLANAFEVLVDPGRGGTYHLRAFLSQRGGGALVPGGAPASHALL